MNLTKIVKWLVAIVAILFVTSIILRGVFSYTNIFIALVISVVVNIFLVRRIISKKHNEPTEEESTPL